MFTGSGKTLAYLLPLKEWLQLGSKVDTDMRRPRNFQSGREGRPILDRTSDALAMPFALILVPTRELATQIFNDIVNLTAGTWISAGVLYGGTDRSEHAATLRRGFDVLVATPGRLIDVVSNIFTDGHPTLSLRHVSIMVLDEADELMSEDFTDQSDTIQSFMDLGAVNYWFFSSQCSQEQEICAIDTMSDKHLRIAFSRQIASVPEAAPY